MYEFVVWINENNYITAIASVVSFLEVGWHVRASEMDLVSSSTCDVGTIKTDRIVKIR